jgi:cysteine protease ATG4
MANNDFTRFSKKVVQYFWDPLPRNEDPSQVWCLGRSYDSRFHHAPDSKATATSPSAHSDSGTSQADSAVVAASQPKHHESTHLTEDSAAKSQTGLSRDEEEALGWPADFLDDLESRIWLTYRSNFPPIPKSSDPAATSAMSFSTKLRNLANQGAFTSDTGWGCMIRSGQSMLANTLAMLQLGREWRLGQKEQEHKALLALFSIHKFVEHGAEACGKHPGEWFGPSATAQSIQYAFNIHSTKS